MNSFSRASVLALPLLVLACGQPENPHIAYCQGIVEKAVGDVEWGDTSSQESNIAKTIKAAYTIDGESGNISCSYPYQRIDGDHGKYAGAPDSVSINGQKMSMRDLASASFKATRETVTKVASETAKQTQKVAEDATEQAGVLVEQAEQKGRELAAEAEQQLGRAAERASELSGQAQELAGQAGQRLKDALQNQ